MDAALELVEAILLCLAHRPSRELVVLREACELIAVILHISAKRVAIDEVEEILSHQFGKDWAVESLVDAMKSDPSLEQRCIRLIAGLAEGGAGNPPFFALMLTLSIAMATGRAHT